MKPDDENKTGNETPVENPVPAQPTMEDQPSEPAISAAPVQIQPTVKKTPWYTQVLRYLLVAVVFFIAGALVIYFTYTRDAFKDAETLRAAATESAQKIDSLETDLSQAKADLASAQATITENQDALDTASIKLLVSKMEKDVTTARIALLTLDPDGTTQALSFAQRDLDALSAGGLDAKSISGFQDRLDEALANLESDPAKALDALEKLTSSLYLLETNLE